MDNDKPTDQRTIVLFLLGWLLFNYPLLALFSDHRTILGIPLLYAYMFLAWILLVGVAALISARLR